MSRESLIQPAKVAKPTIVVNGQSSTHGRLDTLLRIRPTLMERVKRVSVGPMYLIIEHALEELLLHVGKRPQSKLPLYIPGYQMGATETDVQMLEQARAQAEQLKANEKKGATAKAMKDAAAAKRALSDKPAKAPRAAA